MAKPRSIPGLSEDDTYAAAAAKVVSVRTNELAANAAGVLDTNEIEGVHDMRVATRRLRAALEVFEPCFPRKRYRATLREVKALADALGERRDRDVTIVALRRVAAAVDQADQPGLESLIARIRAEQDDANLDLVPHVAPERLAALVAMLEELAAEAAARVGGPEPERLPLTAAPATGVTALAQRSAGNGAGVEAASGGAESE